MMGMTIEAIRKSTKIHLTAVDVAGILNVDPCAIRAQAHLDPRKLGYPVSVCGRRVKIPRIGFLHWLDYGYALPEHLQPVPAPRTHLEVVNGNA